VPTSLRSRLLTCAFIATLLCCTVAGLHDADVAAAQHAPWPDGHKRLIRTLGDRAAAIAVKEVGVPYRWGGSSPATGFDCSGLVYWTYSRLGIALPHSSYALFDMGRRVARSRMRPGDVLIFSGLGHVGIYIGRGRMVHAPHSGTVVQMVRLGSSSYGSRIVGIRRIRKH
jgi:cell wall-associated NlpC family hydrolase